MPCFQETPVASLAGGHMLLVRLLLGHVAWELYYFICLKIKLKREFNDFLGIIMEADPKRKNRRG